LKLITFWDWNNEIMIVDLSEENKSFFKNNTNENKVEDIKTKFKNLRENRLMFIGNSNSG
ncbi:11076_t:CDS:1, partial [Scutellospora calospora]